MKAFPLVLTLSLVGNIALAALVLTRTASAVSTATKTETATAAATAAEARALAAAKAKAAAENQLWSTLNSTDPATLLARLRAAGFPPSVVRAIVAAQIRADFAARRRALNPDAANTPFWKIDRPDPKIAAALRDLGKEQTNLLNQLFGGPDPDAYLGMSVYERQQWGDLPNDKVAQLSRVQRDYQELRSEIYQNAGIGNGGAFTLLPEDRAKIDLLEKEQRADFAQILSPEELEDYNLRSSNTANQMRYTLSAFNPSEAEFRSIYQLQAAFDAKYGQNTQYATQEQMRQRGTEQQKLNAEIKSMLGTDRGAEYERAIDYNYQRVSLVAERLNLPQTAATDVWNVQKSIQQQMQTAMTDTSLSMDEGRTKQATILAEANAKVTAALGEKGAAIYKQNGGSWLQPQTYRSTAPGAATSTGVIRLGP